MCLTEVTQRMEHLIKATKTFLMIGRDLINDRRVFQTNSRRLAGLKSLQVYANCFGRFYEFIKNDKEYAFNLLIPHTKYHISKNVVHLGKEIQNYFKMLPLTNSHYMAQFLLKVIHDGEMLRAYSRQHNRY